MEPRLFSRISAQELAAWEGVDPSSWSKSTFSSMESTFLSRDSTSFQGIQYILVPPVEKSAISAE
jgi:hypothetical protein